jgi:hypothetical protein
MPSCCRYCTTAESAGPHPNHLRFGFTAVHCALSVLAVTVAARLVLANTWPACPSRARPQRILSPAGHPTRLISLCHEPYCRRYRFRVVRDPTEPRP